MQKSVIISGAGIGIGEGLAKAFAAEQYRVIVTDVLVAEGYQLVDKLKQDGAIAQFYEMDVSDTEQVNQVIAESERDHGPFSCVVCNAGIAKTIPFTEMTDEDWDTTLDIDLKGMMRMIRAATPAMRKRQSGAIICLASIVGTTLGWNKHVPYSAAKAGVSGLVRGAAIELAATVFARTESRQASSVLRKRLIRSIRLVQKA